MADDGNIISNLDLGPASGNGEDTQPIAGIIQQYIKDLSIENPNSPASYQWDEAPELDVQFNITATPVNEEVQEVELKINLVARNTQGVLYLIELAYAGLVGMRNLDEAQSHAFVYAEAPRILFPFARRIVADAVRDTGFPPVMLEPVDFNGLYMQQLAQQGEGAPVGNA